MYNLRWLEAEKELSRRILDETLQAELAETMAEFKAQAAAASKAEDMWAVQTFLAKKQHDIDHKYDHRYSQLILVFSRLLREGRIRMEQLEGLSEEKLGYIRRIVDV